MTLNTLSSIFDLKPLEEGGSVARTGFLYQDHVAARFCIEMLSDPCLTEVWCETEDDIVLIWSLCGGTRVEFVQVKSDELSQLWTPALLCSGGESDSIAAKSLAHDRCSEPCCFRIVTRTGVHPKLQPLLLPRDDGDRCLGNPKMVAIHAEVSNALKNALSPRGRSASHWLAETLWRVGESETALEDGNLRRLEQYLENIGEHLFTDQLVELYHRVLMRVQEASFPKWKANGKKKKLPATEFRNWLLGMVAQVRGPAPTKSGKNLKRKMEAAELSQAALGNADQLRIAYRQQTLSPQYHQDAALKSAELEVTAVIQQLLSNLDAGNFPDNGPQFHAQCLTALQAIQTSFPGVGLRFLQGALYSATDRCRHRFRRAAT